MPQAPTSPWPAPAFELRQACSGGGDAAAAGPTAVWVQDDGDVDVFVGSPAAPRPATISWSPATVSTTCTALGSVPYPVRGRSPIKASNSWSAPAPRCPDGPTMPNCGPED